MYCLFPPRLRTILLCCKPCLESLNLHLYLNLMFLPTDISIIYILHFDCQSTLSCRICNNTKYQLTLLGLQMLIPDMKQSKTQAMLLIKEAKYTIILFTIALHNLMGWMFCCPNKVILIICLVCSLVEWIVGQGS